MANISSEARAEFIQKNKAVRESIKGLLEREKTMLALMKQDNSGIEYKKLLLCEEMIFVATKYISINAMSMAILDTRNHDSLNDARKSVYKAIIYLEEIVSGVVDCPFADLEPKQATISNIPIEKRFYLVRKLGLAIQLLSDAFGDNTKWKWTFVEIWGRFTAVAKNMIDMKQAAKDSFDPASPDYETSVLYVRMLRKQLDKSADEYRDKYELSTRSSEDMKKAISFLIANRRIAMALGDNDESEEIRKKALAWKARVENDRKKGSSS